MSPRNDRLRRVRREADQPSQEDGSSSWIAVALVVVVLIALGNGGVDFDLSKILRPQPSVPSGSPSTTAVCAAIADRIEAGKIATSDELVMLIKSLIDGGDLPKDFAGKFDAAFPGIVAKPRQLKKEDGATIRGIK